jgi:hypothetical protein
MQLAQRLTLIFSLTVTSIISSPFRAQAQPHIYSSDLHPSRSEARLYSSVRFRSFAWAADFTMAPPPAFNPQSWFTSFGSSIDSLELLQAAINDKLGSPYRLHGTGERGYDCSGFVWRVFQDAGVNFERASARDLWDRFRAATDEESRQFGMLVFFDDLKHMGIVRDAFSFYHASASQGVVLSSFAGYWAERITGFRRAPLPGELKRTELGNGGSEMNERSVKTNQRPRRVFPPDTRR